MSETKCAQCAFEAFPDAYQFFYTTGKYGVLSDGLLCAGSDEPRDRACAGLQSTGTHVCTCVVCVCVVCVSAYIIFGPMMFSKALYYDTALYTCTHGSTVHIARTAALYTLHARPKSSRMHDNSVRLPCQEICAFLPLSDQFSCRLVCSQMHATLVRSRPNLMKHEENTHVPRHSLPGQSLVRTPVGRSAACTVMPPWPLQRRLRLHQHTPRSAYAHHIVFQKGPS